MMGTPCSASSACGGTQNCGRPGEATRPNGCLFDDEASPQPLCLPVTTEEGECTFGPNDSLCAQQPHRGCSSDTDCQPPNGNIPGDVCVSQRRRCFLDPIVATGAADVPVGSVTHPLLAATMCLGPTIRAAQNNVSGLPGPARLVWPLELTLQP